jgi:hypothetical protein
MIYIIIITLFTLPFPILQLVVFGVGKITKFNPRVLFWGFSLFAFILYSILSIFEMYYQIRSAWSIPLFNFGVVQASFWYIFCVFLLRPTKKKLFTFLVLFNFACIILLPILKLYLYFELNFPQNLSWLLAIIMIILYLSIFLVPVFLTKHKLASNKS